MTTWRAPKCTCNICGSPVEVKGYIGDGPFDYVWFCSSDKCLRSLGEARAGTNGHPAWTTQDGEQGSTECDECGNTLFPEEEKDVVAGQPVKCPRCVAMEAPRAEPA